MCKTGVKIHRRRRLGFWVDSHTQSSTKQSDLLKWYLSLVTQSLISFHLWSNYAKCAPQAVPSSQVSNAQTLDSDHRSKHRLSIAM